MENKQQISLLVNNPLKYSSLSEDTNLFIFTEDQILFFIHFTHPAKIGKSRLTLKAFCSMGEILSISIWYGLQRGLIFFVKL